MTWKSAIGPSVPKTLKGPDAPTESERVAHEITHLPPLGRDIEAPHVRLTPLERDERPIIAMGLAVRKARADDGKADDDLGPFLAIVDSSTGCMRAIASETKRSPRLPCKLIGRLREKMFVGRFRLRCHNEPSIMAVAEEVKAKMPDRVVVETTPRYSSASLAERNLRITPYSATGHGWSGTLDFVSRDTHVERVASHRSGQRMIATTRKRLFRLQKLSCSRSWHQNTEDCHQERDSTKGHCVGERDLVR